MQKWEVIVTEEFRAWSLGAKVGTEGAQEKACTL